MLVVALLIQRTVLFRLWVDLNVRNAYSCFLPPLLVDQITSPLSSLQSTDLQYREYRLQLEQLVIEWLSAAVAVTKGLLECSGLDYVRRTSSKYRPTCGHRL